jgi:chaperone modulatory protein CbpM
MKRHEFLLQSRLEAHIVDAWIEAGWLRPQGRGRAIDFSDIDMARASLIRDLQRDLGVNDEAIPVILDLLDQLHGVRRLLRHALDRQRG